MAKPKVSLALAAFDRHMPFFLGQVTQHCDFDLLPLDVGVSSLGRDGWRRHERMLHDMEFDAAEVSFASFIMARRRGVPITAVPVFPRRLFSQNCIYVHKDGGIQEPADLAGRRIAVRGFQVTLSVMAKGDLKVHHGVDWRDIHWFSQDAETVAWRPPLGTMLEAIEPGKTAAEMLVSGEVDALFDPRPPAGFFESGVVRPLFADPSEASSSYFGKTGYFPIMHVLAVREKTVAAFPDLPSFLVTAWEQAKALTRALYDDPAFSLMPNGIYALRRDRQRFGDDPWPSGLTANRTNIEDFVGYMRDQTLLDGDLDITSLFAEAAL